MKQKEIEHAAKEWAENFDSYDPTFMGIKRMTAEISYRKGAEAVNERQPYSVKDMIAFVDWSHNGGYKRHILEFSDGDKIVRYTKTMDIVFKSADELLKLWEETK